jgi:hypothetical protein
LIPLASKIENRADQNTARKSPGRKMVQDT